MADTAALRQRHQAVPVIDLSRSDPSSSSSDSDSSSYEQDESIPTFAPPTFTIKELLGCIPKHCFERSALRSGAFVVQDLCMIGALVYAATYIDPSFGRQGALLDGNLGVAAKVAAWALYAYLAGLPGTGVWVTAHECGHGAFSSSKKINNAVGWVLHSALMVPYHSWRITHAQHHAATGHMTRDQVFVPKTRSDRGLKPLPATATKAEREGTLPSSYYDKVDDLLEDAPIWALFNILVQQLVGWPAYILMNASGQRSYPKTFTATNHFRPSAIMFNARHRRQVLISDLGIGLVAAALTYLGYKQGFSTVVKYYIVPYLWVNHWLVCITYLQHTDPSLPHYREGAFNFQRGALCTIDRSIHDVFFHHIADTHVAHHLCSAIPHYHGEAATKALKEKLGSYYTKSDENWMTSIYKSYTQCRFVEDEGDVVFYKNAKGKASRRVVYPSESGSVSDSGVDVSEESVRKAAAP